MGLELLVVGALLLLAGVGVRGWVRGRRHRPLAGWRLAAWLAGLALVWLATASPLAGLDRALLTVHMLKHLVLMTVAAPLLLVAEPLALLSRAPLLLTAESRGEQRARAGIDPPG